MMSFKGKKVLVVDDEPGFRELLADEFEIIDATVVTAENGAKAFEIYQSEKIDAIVTDIRMPGGSGIELLNRIKTVNSSLPVIILITGYSDLTLDEAYDRGAEAVFSKPFNLEQLVESVYRSLLPEKERWSQRFELMADDFRVELDGPSLDAAVSAHVINIGRGGMFVAIDGRLPERDRRVSFRIKGPAGGFEGIGVCRWNRGYSDAGLARGAGIEFQDLNGEAMDALLRLLNLLRSTPFIPKV